MFGEVFRCTKCDFSFSSGWSHHAGGQLLICRVCGRDFILGGGQSGWGANAGELLELVQSADGKVLPTGISLTVKTRSIPEGEDWDGISYLEIPNLACPCCGRADAVVQSLEEGQSCPACHQGTVIATGSCIY